MTMNTAQETPCLLILESSGALGAATTPCSLPQEGRCTFLTINLSQSRGRAGRRGDCRALGVGGRAQDLLRGPGALQPAASQGLLGGEGEAGGQAAGREVCPVSGGRLVCKEHPQGPRTLRQAAMGRLHDPQKQTTEGPRGGPGARPTGFRMEEPVGPSVCWTGHRATRERRGGWRRARPGNRGNQQRGQQRRARERHTSDGRGVASSRRRTHPRDTRTSDKGSRGENAARPERESRKTRGWQRADGEAHRTLKRPPSCRRLLRHKPTVRPKQSPRQWP